MDKDLSKKELDAIKHIRNELVHNGEFPSVRNLMKALGYSSPNSAAVILKSLNDKKIIGRGLRGFRLKDGPSGNNSNAQTINIPLVGTVACGLPIYAEENIEAMIPVSKKLVRPGSKYFLLHAEGDSMTGKGINDGDLLLVRQQQTADEGQVVIALIDDEATVKELHVSSEVVILKPRSKNKSHQPIILDRNFLIQGVVVATIPKF